MKNSFASQILSRRFTPRFLLPVCLLLMALSAELFAQSVAFNSVQRTLGSGHANPSGVAIDGKSGNIYVADKINNAVYELVAVGGSIPASPTIISLGSGFQTPTGVAVDGNGNVYVADSGNHAVKEIEAVGGTIPASPTILTLGSGFSTPTGVALDSSGNVYVADISNGTAKEVFAVGGSIPPSPNIRTLVSGLPGPTGIAVDRNRNVYVADSVHDCIWEIQAVGGNIPTPPTVVEVGNGPFQTPAFQKPSGVAADASGNVYVADAGDTAVFEMLVSGVNVPQSPVIKRLAGGFSAPSGVGLDRSGNVYLADTGNSAVKEVLPAGANFGLENLPSTSVSLSLQFAFLAGGSGISVDALTEGSPGLDFADAGTGSCTTNGTGYTYNAGDICTVDVAFSPRFAGLRRGAVLLLSAESGDELASVPVWGVGAGAQIGFISTAQETVGGDLNFPVDVAVTGAGDVLISDSNNNRVVEVPADGGQQTIVADGLSNQWSLALDGAGNLYIADTGNNRVLRVDGRNGTQTTVGTGLSLTRGVAVDGAGNVFIADETKEDVVEVPGNGGPQVTVATGSWVPMGIAVDGAGSLFITEVSGRVIDEVSPPDPSPSLYATGFSSPFGVALDAAGDLYVADSGNTSVIEVPPLEGAHILLGQFTQVNGVATDAAGDLFVADSSRVVKLPLSQPPSLSFSSTANMKTVTLKNSGNRYLVLPGIVQGTNPVISNASFNLNTTGATSCAVVTASSPTPGTLAPGRTCDLIVTFSPSDGGTQTGTLVLTDNNLNASPTAFTSQTISLTGTASVTLPDITWPSPASILYGTALSATQLNATANTAGTFSYSPAAGTVLGVGTHTLSVNFTPTDTTNFTTASTTVTLTVNQAVPAIIWAPPAAITYGTALSSKQLDAASAVPGKFAYSPPAGTRFPAGLQTLWATFTPNDTADYTSATASVSLTVNKAGTTTKVVSSLNPSVTPQSVTFTATVTSPLAGAIGTVTFKDGSTIFGSGKLNSSGIATYSTSTLTVGTHSITAVYVGDINNLRSTSAALSQVVNGVPAALTSPAPSSVLPGPKVTFTWGVTGGATDYGFRLGTSVGAGNLYASGPITVTSVASPALPTNGETIYARLITYYGSSQVYTDYVFTAATRAALISPTPSTVLTGPRVTFTWSAAAGSTDYGLRLGTTVGANNLYGSGPITATSVASPALPINGETIYARLITYYGSTQVYTDYIYTAAP